MDYKFLDNINSASDLRALSSEEMNLLADEIRDFLVKKVEHTGGHLASNLGVVELTLALHRVFFPARYYFMDVALMSDVPYYPVLRCVKDTVERKRKLYHSEI